MKKEYTKEYIVVADVTSKIIVSVPSYVEAKQLASNIRKAGGQVTIFVSTKG